MNKTISAAVLAVALGIAPVAGATNFGGDTDNSIHNTATGGNAVANGGAGGAGGSVVGSGNSANSNRNDASAFSVSGSNSSAKQGQFQGQDQGQSQGQGIEAFNGNTTTVEAPDMKGFGSELRGAAREHAESAAEVRSNSNVGATPCGDSTGLSGQVGVAGAGLATVTESCRAFRLQQLEKGEPKALSTRLAEVTHFVGWLPRLLLHVATFGVLN